LVKIDSWLKNKKPSTLDVNNLTIIQSVKIGLYQCVAMIPGVSRSGATIVGGRLVGLSHQAAVEYSFLLGIPTILGACAKKILDYRTEIPLFFNSAHLPYLAISFVISFIIALITIRYMVSFITKYGFVYFGYYRILIGILLSLYLWLK
jgi:undecaprenyl-diphosphatase